MNFTSRMDASGIGRAMDVIKKRLGSASGNAGDIKSALKRFGAYKVAMSKHSFQEQGPGWEPRANKTVAHAKTYAHQVLEGKLIKELHRAKKKAKSPAAVERRQAVLNEFRRLMSGSNEETALHAKLAAKLKTRIAQQEEKYANAPLLGKMARAMAFKAQGDGVLIENKIGFSAVHNEGGPAGHGAEEPKREFLPPDLSEDDWGVLESMIFGGIMDQIGDQV